jgi:hypothetical protein
MFTLRRARQERRKTRDEPWAKVDLLVAAVAVAEKAVRDSQAGRAQRVSHREVVAPTHPQVVRARVARVPAAVVPVVVVAPAAVALAAAVTLAAAVAPAVERALHTGRARGPWPWRSASPCAPCGATVPEHCDVYRPTAESRQLRARRMWQTASTLPPEP